MYLLIFTCLSARAVHIELLRDVSSHDLVFTLIRFYNVYSIPTHIYSDNGRSIIAGCNLIIEVFITNEFSDKFGKFNIKNDNSFVLALVWKYFGRA